MSAESEGILNKETGLSQGMHQLFITTPEFNQRLDLIRHLIGSSDRAPLIRGVDGVGKSTLLTRLQEIAPDDWEICRIEATATLQQAQIYPLLARCFGSTGEVFSDIAGLMRRFEDLHQAGRLPVLLVDDTHLLPFTTLLELVEFHSAAQRQGSRIALVLAASPQIDDHINSHQFRSASHLLQTLELLPFDREQTAQMVRETLALNVEFGAREITSKWIDKIQSQSQGIPGKIRQILERELNLGGDLSVAGTGGIKSSFLSDIPLPVFVGSLLLLILMSLTLVYQDEINALFEPDVTEVDAPADAAPTLEQVIPLALPEQVEAEPASGPEEVVDSAQEPSTGSVESTSDPTARDAIPSGSMQSAELPEPVSQADDPAIAEASKVQTVSPVPASSVDTPKLTPAPKPDTPLQTAPKQSEAASAPQSKPVVAAPPTLSQAAEAKPVKPPEARETTEEKSSETLPSAPVIEQSRPLSNESAANLKEEKRAATISAKTTKPPRENEPAPVVDEAIRREAWLLKQRPGNYTLQLIGVKDERGVDEFIRRHGLKGKVASFRSMRGGKPWFSVVYGVYPSRGVAVAALKELPKQLSNTGAWPRTFGSIQEAIGNN